MRSLQKAAQEVVLENNDNNDMQCGCPDVMQVEDGKLQEWPNEKVTSDQTVPTNQHMPVLLC